MHNNIVKITKAATYKVAHITVGEMFQYPSAHSLGVFMKVVEPASIVNLQTGELIHLQQVDDVPVELVEGISIER